MNKLGKIGMLALGFLLGSFTYKMIFASKVSVIENALDALETNSAIEAQQALFIANSIHSKDTDKAAAYLEAQIVSSISTFTDSGRRKLAELTPREKMILESAKEYQNKNCTNKCFDQIGYILNKI